MENGERVKPFSHISLDAAGPIVLSATQKRWLIVFVCRTYKCVHLEVVNNMSSETFLLAFSCFTARRGVPHSVHSDNSTNFTAADKELQILWSKIDPKETREHFHKVQWTFSPPGAPHTNGLAEIMVKWVK